VHCIKVLIFVALGNHQASDLFITLGSCRFLDRLVVEECVEARKKIVRGFGFCVVRGIVLTSPERLRATLVESRCGVVLWF
jgi:hypothetical protein